jgi:hypothetical protein
MDAWPGSRLALRRGQKGIVNHVPRVFERGAKLICAGRWLLDRATDRAHLPPVAVETMTNYSLAIPTGEAGIQNGQPVGVKLEVGLHDPFASLNVLQEFSVRPAADAQDWFAFASFHGVCCCILLGSSPASRRVKSGRRTLTRFLSLARRRGGEGGSWPLVSQTAAFKDRPRLDDELLVGDIALHIAAGEKLHLFGVN